MANKETIKKQIFLLLQEHKEEDAARWWWWLCCSFYDVHNYQEKISTIEDERVLYNYYIFKEKEKDEKTKMAKLVFNSGRRR